MPYKQEAHPMTEGSPMDRHFNCNEERHVRTLLQFILEKTRLAPGFSQNRKTSLTQRCLI